MLLLSYCVEFYSLLPARVALLAKYLPPLSGDVKHLLPGLFSICTHLVASNECISRPVDQGGLGYRGVLTTLEGMCMELVDWNKEQEEHAKADTPVSSRAATKWYRSSVSLAEEIYRLSDLGKTSKI